MQSGIGLKTLPSGTYRFISFVLLLVPITGWLLVHLPNDTILCSCIHFTNCFRLTVFDKEIANISERMKKEEGSIQSALKHMKELSSELYKNVSGLWLYPNLYLFHSPHQSCLYLTNFYWPMNAISLMKGVGSLLIELQIEVNLWATGIKCFPVANFYFM